MSCARIWLFGGLFLVVAACDGGKGRESVFLDRAYGSRCEAMEAIAKFALENHLVRSTADFSSLRQKLPLKLAQTLKVESAGAELGDCADVESIGATFRAGGKELSDKDLYEIALKTLISLLDPHSSWLPPAEGEAYMLGRENIQFGIGAEFRTRVVNRWQPPTELSIEEVYTDGPSAGLLEAGDRIVGINQKSFGALSLERILSVLEGSDPVTLQILGRTDWIEVQPEQFRASPIFSKRIHEGEANLGYTHIRRFTLDVSVRLQHALEKFEEQNVSALIIDLRGDGGGDTNEVVRCADLFVDQGVLLRLRGSGKKGIPAEFQINAVLGAETGGEVTRKPVVILVDARTASSAEMFAGVLAESSRAVLVGYEGGTFGKWTGQSIAKLGEKNGFGGRLVLTTFRVTLFDGADAQANGYPVHFKVSDPKLEQVVADRRKNNVTTILQERDYGADLVIPSTGRAVRAGSGSAIASIIDGTREAVDPELIQAACRPEEDCEYKVAVQVAADLADRKPEWPEIRTKLDE